jgi:hypothetical protein
MDKTIQAKHIDDVLIIDVIRHLRELRRRASYNQSAYNPRIPTQDILNAVDFPPKVVLSKLRALQKRVCLNGCACGCRGDWELTEYGFLLFEISQKLRGI